MTTVIFVTACTGCGSTKVGLADFEDGLSFREFGLSGLCQVCQDEVFCFEEEEE